MNTKICFVCGLDLPIDQFGVYTRNFDGLQHKCKSCKKIYDNNFYAKRPIEKKNHKVKLQHQRVNELTKQISELKSTTPCGDCGRYGHPYAMDFDHIDNDKLNNVSHLVKSGFSVENIMKEIAKCELVCAYCHRIRTWTRMQQRGVGKQ